MFTFGLQNLNMIQPFYYLKEIEKYDNKHLCLLLGISRQTVWNWEHKGMPFHKVKSSKYYILEEVLDWMRCQPKLIEIYIEFKRKINN
tara:strand:- start:618 stop:881 length:264 start_codon:yes stop_codon:yes gene_type:complete